MATSFEQRRAEFGDRLRQLREAADFNGKAFAAVLGWNAPKVSKIEKGRQNVTTADLDAWLAPLDIPVRLAKQLHADLDALNAEYVTWKEKVRAGHRARQQESLDREANAHRIRAVDVGIVPGLLQTADYARHVLRAHAALHGGGDDLEDAVRTRMRRQQVLYDPSGTIDLLMTESALLHPVAPPDVMTGQVNRLMGSIGIPNVRFGILPVGVELPYMLLHGYWIVDDLVTIETATGEQTVPDPDEVATYNTLTDKLWTVAAEGDAASDVLARAARPDNR